MKTILKRLTAYLLVAAIVMAVIYICAFLEEGKTLYAFVMMGALLLVGKIATLLPAEWYGVKE